MQIDKFSASSIFKCCKIDHFYHTLNIQLFRLQHFNWSICGTNLIFRVHTIFVKRRLAFFDDNQFGIDFLWLIWI